MALLKCLAFFMFPPSAKNLWWSSTIDSVVRSITDPRCCGGIANRSPLMRHHRQQWRPGVYFCIISTYMYIHV